MRAAGSSRWRPTRFRPDGAHGRGRRAGRLQDGPRGLHLLPLLLINFVESNPGPVKFAMASMGLCEEVYRLPMVPPRPASKERILAVLGELEMARSVGR
ncbi:MAG: hypothetical protein R2712_03670 [Vicinamibacterales bacterium]